MYLTHIRNKSIRITLPKRDFNAIDSSRFIFSVLQQGMLVWHQVVSRLKGLFMMAAFEDQWADSLSSSQALHE